MKKHVIATAVAAIALPALIAAAPGSSGPGKVSIGVDASEWSSTTSAGDGRYPVGGSGQVNGEFVTAERYGIQIGLRAHDSGQGTLEAVATDGNKVAVYQADAGPDEDSIDQADWNYDIHVDLRNAFGVAAGTTLADYDLQLHTDIASTLFTFPVPWDLTFGGAIDDAVLVQTSQNPEFGNAEFQSGEAGTYSFELTLTPTTFNGPPLTVAMQVNVS